jgi:hypothetical protein
MSNQNQLSIRFRNDEDNQWKIAQTQNKGKLIKGEIGVSLIKDTNNDVLEIVGRIGISETPTDFYSCPIVFRSNFDFTNENSEIVKLKSTPDQNSFLVYNINTDGVGEFQTKSYDDVICELQVPENIVIFDTTTAETSGFLRWNVSDDTGQEEGWILSQSTCNVEFPEEIFGGTPESF